MSSSVASGIGVIMYPPALFTPSLFTRTPNAIADGVCSDFAKYSAKSSAISPETNGVNPTYGSFKPISFIIYNIPYFPTAVPTSNFPLSFNGKSTFGFCTYPFISILLFTIAFSDPSGPSAFIWRVIVSLSSFSPLPIIHPIVNNLPNAAVATGLKSCIFLASSTSSVVSIHFTFTFPLYANPLTILSDIFLHSLLFFAYFITLY